MVDMLGVNMKFVMLTRFSGGAVHSSTASFRRPTWSPEHASINAGASKNLVQACRCIGPPFGPRIRTRPNLDLALSRFVSNGHAMRERTPREAGPRFA